MALRKFVAFVRNDVIGRHLLAIQNAPPLMELFVFTKSDFLKAHVNGAPRGAVDTALTNPRSYIDVRFFNIKISFIRIDWFEHSANEPNIPHTHSLATFWMHCCNS